MLLFTKENAMKDKTVNFIYALVVGKVSTGDMNLKNVWDNEMAVKFFINHFIPTFPPKETAIGIPVSYHHLWRDYKNTDIRTRIKKRKK